MNNPAASIYSWSFFFKHSVTHSVPPSLLEMGLDPGSCVEMRSEVSLCFVFMFVLLRLSVVESVTAGVCGGRL